MDSISENLCFPIKISFIICVIAICVWLLAATPPSTKLNSRVVPSALLVSK
ncbi:hypothetical protein HanXRQr2_Chr15g0713371 [Helianthus annuus]|uniref:Uncharacterized protein n=1 Tax=Helianthus annuus TaxID=4232 RepID=A0A9K3E574_HELAN|nr:hypothetical protein HanXRQr2_Chr15g0713371 [Helianthus annuus]